MPKYNVHHKRVAGVTNYPSVVEADYIETRENCAVFFQEGLPRKMVAVAPFENTEFIERIADELLR